MQEVEKSQFSIEVRHEIPALLETRFEDLNLSTKILDYLIYRWSIDTMHLYIHIIFSALALLGLWRKGILYIFVIIFHSFHVCDYIIILHIIYILGISFV